MNSDSLAPDVFERLQKAAAADPEELAALCRDYLAEGRRTLAHLRSALAQKDATRFRDRAHYLRGSSLVIGATAVARWCASLEQMGRDASFVMLHLCWIRSRRRWRQCKSNWQTGWESR